MLQNLWKDPVWSKVIATGIVAVAGVLGAYLLGYWPVIASTASAGLSFLLASSEISNWAIALLVLGAAPTALVLVALAWHGVRGKSVDVPNWTSYTTDEFFGLRWRWHYVDGSIARLHTFCPKCDYQVFARDASTYNFISRISYSCDSCKADLAEIDESEALLNSKVERWVLPR